ncbi:membrane-associated tyrosine- and threonine-specific cdc2-inhibitory kinase-like isoform X2 [Dysidea avara]|uniref:membrane-associated tyrosine- and threonine-specific cdc2-inhibitory kinase-like isoform X2 n=1 Tax=Dysidea avara TaxID=196820 RepID=UPI00331D6BB8
MAPELMQGRFGKPADIFNLGISLLEMACDMKLPNGGNAWHQLRSGYLPDEFTSHLSTELLDILKWMMHPQPQSRPTADQLLAYSSLISGYVHHIDIIKEELLSYLSQDNSLHVTLV